MALMVMRACRPGSADMRQPRRRRAAPAGVRSWSGHGSARVVVVLRGDRRAARGPRNGVSTAPVIAPVVQPSSGRGHVGKVHSKGKRVLSPELQECMDRTKGALLRAHTAGSRKTPKACGLSAGGVLAHQSGVNKRRREESQVITSQGSRENHGGRRRHPVITARSAHSAQARSKTKTHRPPHQPPGRHPISIVRSRGPSSGRTVARTIETISVSSGETPEAREATEDRSGIQYQNTMYVPIA
jgi:hypothetical protein